MYKEISNHLVVNISKCKIIRGKKIWLESTLSRVEDQYSERSNFESLYLKNYSCFSYEICTDYRSLSALLAYKISWPQQ